MAPIFGSPRSPTSTRQRGHAPGPAPAQVPAFSFNMRTKSSASGFFRAPDSPADAQRISSMEDGWDMDMGAGANNNPFPENDNSRALTFRPGEFVESVPLSPVEDIDEYHPEIDAFAIRVDLAKENDEIVRGYMMITDFKDIASDRVEQAENNIEQLHAEPQAAHGEEWARREYKAEIDLKHWKLEHQTWDLFGNLLAHRISTQNIEDNAARKEWQINRYASNTEITAYLLEVDRVFGELNLIRQWLYDYARDPSEAVLEVEDQYRNDQGWLYTKEKIKSAKRLHGLGKMAALGAGTRTVSELDPDAATRQLRPLEAEDEAWEALLMRLVWNFIRKGDIQGAKDLCADVGQWWRSATLGGGEDAYDPNLGEGEGEADEMADEPVTYRVLGNRRRELWKRMCYALSQQRSIEEYERAVYGTLCGDIDSVLPVCETWEDYLFAHINSLVESCFTRALVNFSRIPTATSQFPSFDAVTYHSHAASLSEDEELKGRLIDGVSSLDDVKVEARNPVRIVQAAMISERFGGLVGELSRQLEYYAEFPEYDPTQDEQTNGVDVADFRTLRIVVHTILILQALDFGFTPGQPGYREAEIVIAGYVDILGAEQKFELVPLYASKLSTAKAIEVVGKVLLRVPRQSKDRELLITLMQHHGVDYLGCLKQAMRLSLGLHQDKYDNSLTSGRGILSDNYHSELKEEDDILIGGLEWLILGGDELRGELVRMASVVYRRFFLSGRLAATKKLFETIPSESIIPPLDPTNEYANGDISMADMEADDVFMADPETSIAARAFLQYGLLVAAINSLDAWKQAIADRPDRVDRTYKQHLTDLFEETRLRLPEVIKTLFNDPRTQSIPNIPTIRNMYIPELVFALHRVYIDAGKYVHKNLLSETLELATVVADPASNSLAPFEETGRLQEYVNELAMASRAILGAGQLGGSKLVKAMSIWNV